ncbi:MAG: phosphoribosylanthranilate isomerase [Deltaproteobacteria bacterium]|nr:phosphoribosylanthranilate isomerase [Deltaproteobacteria bacterium]
MEAQRTKIKICGITRLEDALLAADLGADALGFIFAESPRQVVPETARKIISLLPPFVNSVGVFVDEEQESVREIAAYCKLDLVQLHGNESSGYCKALDLKALKVIRVKDEKSIESMASYRGTVQGFLLDTYVKGLPGGTGKTFNWELAKQAKKYGPVILSGGLNPDNICEAIEKVKPYGVDISSGVEASPGIKDPDKLKLLFSNI